MHVRSEIKRASDLYTSARCSARELTAGGGVPLTRVPGLVCVSPVTSQVHRHSRLSKKALTSDTFFSHLDAGARRTLKI